MATNNTLSNMLKAGKSLGLFAVITTAIVAVTFIMTEPQIIENKRLSLLKSLHELIPPNRHDNDLYADVKTLDVTELNFRGKPITVYRARQNNKHSAAIFSVTAPDGYTGAIDLLIAINADNTVAGVRVVNHKETPGLGDAIEIEKSNWITIFDGQSLSNPLPKNWKVKKDGGQFDQLTGATITPRAIVKITKKTLQYFQANHDVVFTLNEDAPNTKTTTAGEKHGNN